MNYLKIIFFIGLVSCNTSDARYHLKYKVLDTCRSHNCFSLTVCTTTPQEYKNTQTLEFDPRKHILYADSEYIPERDIIDSFFTDRNEILDINNSSFGS